jgi:hypothetical protein
MLVSTALSSRNTSRSGAIPPIPGVFQNRVTLEAGLMRAGPAGDTLIFSGVVRDGSMCWRGGETAGE